MTKQRAVKGSSSDRSNSRSGLDRRQLLRAAAKASAVMAALGLSGVSLGAASKTAGLSKIERSRLDLIQFAIKNRDMKAAIAKYAKDAELDQRATAALLKLTPTDLRNLQSIQEKLAEIKGEIYIRY